MLERLVAFLVFLALLLGLAALTKGDDLGLGVPLAPVVEEPGSAVAASEEDEDDDDEEEKDEEKDEPDRAKPEKAKKAEGKRRGKSR